jgi:hypothetical protein
MHEYKHSKSSRGLSPSGAAFIEANCYQSKIIDDIARMKDQIKNPDQTKKKKLPHD